VKTFGRFSSHRRFEHRKNISAALVIFRSLAVFDYVTSRRTCRERRT
jgi:ERCC4-type nuclease